MLLRRSVLGLSVTAALSLALASGAEAAQTWRMATQAPTDSVEGKIFAKFAELVGEYTQNELEVKIFPSEQLGKGDAVLEQLQLGTIQLVADGSNVLQKWVPDIRFISASFLFKDRPTWVRFMQSPLVQGWYDQVESEAGVGVLGDVTAIVRGPYRVLVVDTPVRSFDDIAGLKLRVPTDRMQTETWKSFGAEVRTLGLTETYSAISSGLVQGLNIPVSLVEDLRIYEVAPYVIRTDEYFQSLAFMMNMAAWNKLEPATQDAVLKAHAETGAYSEELTNKTLKEAIARMEAKGVEFIAIDTTPMIEGMKGWYEAEEKAGQLPQGFLAAVEEVRAQAGN
jgi:TRAP-type C4-dicarboxylate transport system substrate-binding protein